MQYELEMNFSLTSVSCSGTQRISGSGEPLYTPASRGIHTVLEIDGAELCSLCQALPRGVLELSHKLTELHEDSDGMALSFQVCHSMF